MTQDKNIVRDRTLVLRILVPGLHTSLHDKIIPNNRAKDEPSATSSSSSSSSSSWPTDASSSLSGSAFASSFAGGIGGGDHQILSLEGVSCIPSSKGSTLWHFRCDGATYPARLVNLPCPVEVHKTHDHANYHKSADIGQMLIVYEDEYALEEAEADKNYRVEGFPSYYPSGLSPPMHRTVQRRYLSRFEERDTRPCPPPPEDVSIVEDELLRLMMKSSSIAKAGKTKGGPRGGGGMGEPQSSSSSKSKVIEEIEEEIVDYEPWMGEEGGVYTVEDAKLHPEWWLTKAEMREIEGKRLSALEKDKQEQEQLHQQQRLASSSEIGGKGRGKLPSIGDDKVIPPLDKKTKSSAGGGGNVKAKGGSGESKKKSDKKIEKRTKKEKAVLPPTEEIDDAMAAAMTINEGIAEDEDFIDFDDMFDFDNEDITDLL